MKKNLKKLCAAVILPLMLFTGGCFNGETSEEEIEEYEFSHAVAKRQNSYIAYNICPTWQTEQAGYIALLSLTRRVLEACIDVLGFEAPERM